MEQVKLLGEQHFFRRSRSVSSLWFNCLEIQGRQQCMPLDMIPDSKPRPIESATERAERRQLEQALKDSLSTSKSAFSRVKEPQLGAYTKQGTVVFSPGTEQRVDISNLPSIKSAGNGFLNEEEKKNLKETKSKHYSFMLSKESHPLVQH